MSNKKKISKKSKKKLKKAKTSIIELTGPITFMNVPNPFVFHFLGLSKNSSSTLSYGIPICEKSYKKS